jgi:hypothetical protein
MHDQSNLESLRNHGQGLLKLTELSHHPSMFQGPAGSQLARNRLGHITHAPITPKILSGSSHEIGGDNVEI